MIEIYLAQDVWRKALTGKDSYGQPTFGAPVRWVRASAPARSSRRTGRVTRWRDGAMVLRWAAAAAMETEKHFRKVIGHRDLWMLKAALDAGPATAEQAAGAALDEEAILIDKEPVAA